MSQKNITYEKKAMELECRNHSSVSGHLQCMPHLHRELELVCMLDGESVAYADSRRCVLAPGDVFLAFPNQIHSYETYTDERFILFILKPELMPELSDIFQIGLPESPVVKGFLLDPAARTLLDLLTNACSRKKNGTPYVASLRRGYLLAFFSELLSHMSVNQLPVGDSGALRSIVSFCAKNYAENLSLSMLEERLHLNKYYISHLFSGKLGIRFNDYINSLRISEACRLLANSDASITEISERVGFNTLRTFNRAFIKQIGVSPSAYRRGEGGAPVSSPLPMRLTEIDPAAQEPV